MKLIEGFIDKFPNRQPPKSAKGFEWPGRGATDEQRLAFKKRFTEALRERGLSHRDFARLFYGETKTATGYSQPRNANAVLNWADGSAWPIEETAQRIAAFLKVPMDTLVTDSGKPFEPLPMLRKAAASKTRLKKANGHGGNGAAASGVLVGNGALAPGQHEPAPLPPRPADAKPATLHVDSCADAPDYCNVTIVGTVRYDTAMALVNLVGRDQHGLGPRGK